MDILRLRMDEPCVPLDHPRFRSVATAVFTRRFAPDCMAHSCSLAGSHQEQLDVCCQYGCDVDLHERTAIEARGDQIRSLLRDEVKRAPWFETHEYVDADYPSGRVVRTAVHGKGCVFLAHDQRGCAIHRAALEGGWDFRGVKPAICRLFPVSYECDEIFLAEEYTDYSCASAPGPTIYRLTRDALAELFGDALVVALDAAEAQVLAAEALALAAAPRHLPLAK
jgi:Fe-S-cluster containining protein